MSRIAIDPGHGGHKPGAVVHAGHTHEEEDIALAISKLLGSWLEARGHVVLLTRDDDRDVGFKARAIMANAFRADLFVSMHANAAASPAANGAWVLFAKGSVRGAAAARLIFDCIRDDVPGAVDADPEAEVYPDVKPWTNYANGITVLRASSMPAVLVETGFMTNVGPGGDLRDLLDPEFQLRMAAAIGRGIEAWITSEGKRLPLPDVPQIVPKLEDSMRAVREYLRPNMDPVAVLDRPVYVVAQQLDASSPTSPTMRALLAESLRWLLGQDQLMARLGVLAGAVRYGVEILIEKVLDPA